MVARRPRLTQRRLCRMVTGAGIRFDRFYGVPSHETLGDRTQLREVCFKRMQEHERHQPNVVPDTPDQNVRNSRRCPSVGALPPLGDLSDWISPHHAR
jgi:hypothetical protein